ADKSLVLSGSGQITGSTVLFDGGKIASWDISSTQLSSGNIRLIPGDAIELGATDFETGNGIWLGNDGTFSAGNQGAARLTWDGTNVQIHDSSGNALVSLGGTNKIAGWTISTTQLAGTNAILKSGGVLSLGAGTDAYNQANRIYIDGANTQISIGTGFRYASDALTIDGNANFGIGVEILSDACSINHCRVSELNDGIYLNGSARITISDNTIYLNARYGLYLNTSTFDLITDNYILANISHGIYMIVASDAISINDNLIIANSGSGLYRYM
ncbi:hypothetical protein LCGC14_2591950, partial [marine sediment metagenome]